jgi:hypothetical protein
VLFVAGFRGSRNLEVGIKPGKIEKRRYITLT